MNQQGDLFLKRQAKKHYSRVWACLVQDVKLTGLLPTRNHHVDNNLSFFFTFFGKLNILLA